MLPGPGKPHNKGLEATLTAKQPCADVVATTSAQSSTGTADRTGSAALSCNYAMIAKMCVGYGSYG